nr:hypothetical protein [Providencia rettgeri]
MEKNQENTFFVGALWAASVVWRCHTDRIIVGDLLKEIPDIDDVAKISKEYDIQPLRRNVMQTLPLAQDATYESISYGPLDRMGRLICDHTDVTGKDEGDFDSFCVYAVEGNKDCQVLVDDLYSKEEAEDRARIFSEQLTQILAAKQ